MRTGLDALSTQCGAALVAWGVLTALIIGIELRCQTMPSSWWVARTYGVLWPDDNRDGQFSVAAASGHKDGDQTASGESGRALD